MTLLQTIFLFVIAISLIAIACFLAVLIKLFGKFSKDNFDYYILNLSHLSDIERELGKIAHTQKMRLKYGDKGRST